MHRRRLLATLAASLLLAITLGAAAPLVSARPIQLAATAAKGRIDALVAAAAEVTRQVEALRGWTFKQPIKNELTSVDDMRRYLERQTDKSVPPEKLRRVQAFLRTVGLIPKDTDLKDTWLRLLEGQVGGFYDTETKTMHLVAREGIPPFAERIMLAHELTHALDDQWVGLEAFTKRAGQGTEDLDLASASVVEGSATALMMQYAAREMVAGRFDQQALQQYAQQEAERSKVFLEAPRYFSAMLGAYICGAQFLARGQLMALMLAPDDKAIGEALVAARRDPPQSTEQIIHPDKYWDAATRDEPVVIDDDAAVKWLARPGTWVVHRDTIGEMLVAILTAPRGASPNALALQSSAAWTNAAASGWGGDRFYLLASGDTAEAARTGLTNLRGVWVTAWDTAKDRDEFLAALPGGSLAAGAAADAVGTTVAVVYFGVEQAERARLAARLKETPLPMTKGGRPRG